MTVTRGGGWGEKEKNRDLLPEPAKPRNLGMLGYNLIVNQVGWIS